MAVDDDGLLPPWVIYHELVNASSKCMLRKVCAVEAEWVAPALLKLRDMHMPRLGRSGRPAEPSRSIQENPDATPSALLSTSSHCCMHELLATSTAPCVLVANPALFGTVRPAHLLGVAGMFENVTRTNHCFDRTERHTAGAKERRNIDKCGEGRDAEAAQQRLAALKKRALARREAGVGKKARLAPRP